MATKTIHINVKWGLVIVALMVVVVCAVIAHHHASHAPVAARGATTGKSASAATRSGSCNGGQSYAACTANGGLLFTNKPDVLSRSSD